MTMKPSYETIPEGACKAPFSCSSSLTLLLNRLADWFTKEGRCLPWRTHPEGMRADPYFVLVSEIMLQQTRIETVIPYFERFIRRFPTAADLACASEEEVLKLWEGLGYYSRAKNLHKAAKVIAQKGSFPERYQEILALPGVGEYTAGAISSIAFGGKDPAVDGNVMRVMSRLMLLKENVLDEGARKKVRQMLREGYQTVNDPAKVTEGLMELGETICLPQNPACRECPVRPYCCAFEEGMTDQLPVRVKVQKRTVENRLVLVAVDQEGRLLTAKRGSDQVLAGLWELPNVLLKDAASKSGDRGAENPEEKSRETAICLLEDSYGITIDQKTAVYRKAKHVFSHLTWNMTVIEAVADISGSQGKARQTAYRDPDGIMLPTAFKKLL